MPQCLARATCSSFAVSSSKLSVTGPGNLDDCIQNNISDDFQTCVSCINHVTSYYLLFPQMKDEMTNLSTSLTEQTDFPGLSNHCVYNVVFTILGFCE